MAPSLHELPALRLDAILAHLDPNARLAVDLAESVDSTSGELARRAARGDVHRQALIAERQSAGRGRRGREWTSVPGGSLTFSIAWRFQRGAAKLSGLTLAAGLTVAQALETIGFRGVELKWPNDLVHRGAKLGGILVDLAGGSSGSSLAIIGIGINVRLPSEARTRIDQPATDLEAVSHHLDIDRDVVLASILGELSTALDAFAREGFEPLRAAWERRHALQHQRVELCLPDGNRARGEVAGVDEEGALLLDDGEQRLRFVSGEVTQTRIER